MAEPGCGGFFLRSLPALPRYEIKVLHQHLRAETKAYSPLPKRARIVARVAAPQEYLRRRQGAAVTSLSGNNSSGPNRLVEAEPEHSPSKADGDCIFWASVQGGPCTPHSGDLRAKPALSMPRPFVQPHPPPRLASPLHLSLACRRPGPGLWNSNLFFCVGGGASFLPPRSLMRSLIHMRDCRSPKFESLNNFHLPHRPFRLASFGPHGIRDCHCNKLYSSPPWLCLVMK
jgi:hypothetical protein